MVYDHVIYKSGSERRTFALLAIILLPLAAVMFFAPLSNISSVWTMIAVRVGVGGILVLLIIFLLKRALLKIVFAVSPAGMVINDKNYTWAEFEKIDLIDITKTGGLAILPTPDNDLAAARFLKKQKIKYWVGVPVMVILIALAISIFIMPFSENQSPDSGGAYYLLLTAPFTFYAIFSEYVKTSSFPSVIIDKKDAAAVRPLIIKYKENITIRSVDNIQEIKSPR